MQLKYKLPLILFIAYTVLVATLVTGALINSSKVRSKSQFEMAKAAAKDYSETIKSFMSERLTELKGLEDGISVMNNLDDKTKRESLDKLLYSLSDQAAISDAYVVFERGAFFGAEITEPGHYYNIDAFHPLKGGIEVFHDESYTVADDDEWYIISKKQEKLTLPNPINILIPMKARSAQ